MEKPNKPHDPLKGGATRTRYDIPTSVVKACRKEIDDAQLSVRAFTISEQSELIAIPGNIHRLPPDLAGYYFIAAALAEQGTQVINGDGMLYRVHFAGGQATLKSRIAKTPCYYADQITLRSKKYSAAYKFRDGGPSRSSPKLGNRNQLNTAFLQTRRHLVVTFDAGIPWIIDPNSMELVEPIGRMDQWLSLTDPFAGLAPALRDVVFPPHSNPAHPVCDRFKPENSFSKAPKDQLAVLTPDYLLTLNYSVGYKGKFRKTVDRLLGWLRRKMARGTGVLGKKIVIVQGFMKESGFQA